jgi:hypothetical protein
MLIGKLHLRVMKVCGYWMRRWQANGRDCNSVRLVAGVGIDNQNEMINLAKGVILFNLFQFAFRVKMQADAIL